MDTITKKDIENLQRYGEIGDYESYVTEMEEWEYVLYESLLDLFQNP